MKKILALWIALVMIGSIFIFVGIDETIRFLEVHVKPSDKIAPVIKLNNDIKEIYIDDVYVMPTVTASDNIDGDLTNKVIVEGSIDNRKVGIQQLKYTVTDKNNNCTEVVKNVIVKNKPYNNTKQELPILMYHFFYDKSKGEKAKDHNFMEIASFEAQIKYLITNNYYFPTWDEVYKFVNKEISLPQKSVVITVDDGNETFFKYAIPIITKYKAKATSFVVANRVTEEKLQNYRSEYIQFQSHSYNMHRYLYCDGKTTGAFKCISKTEALDDLKKSIEVVKLKDVFAYPYGVTASRSSLVKDAGFHMGVTTVNGKVKPGDNPLVLKRVRMSHGVKLEQFISKL